MFQFESLTGVSHGISSRHGGVSPAPYHSLNVGYGTDDDEENVATNRRLLLERLTLDPGSVVSGRLTHGKEVTVIRRDRAGSVTARHEPVRRGSHRHERFFRSDAVVSDVPDLHFLLTFADCVPLLFHDPIRGAVGAAHAGWRGTAAGISTEVVLAMVRYFGSRPQDIRVGIGPSIGPCCYSVGGDVLQGFSRHGTRAAVEDLNGRTHLDLWSSNAIQLRDSGVRAIEQARVCTACAKDTYFSHRAESGHTGRFALVAGLAA